MTGHATYDDTCPRCRTNYMTRRWGCMILGHPYAQGPAPRCPDCDATSGDGHAILCEFWYGFTHMTGPNYTGPRVYRFDDTEPYSPDYARLEVGEDPIISRTMTIVVALVILALIGIPLLPIGQAVMNVLTPILILGGILGGLFGLAKVAGRRRRIRS